MEKQSKLIVLAAYRPPNGTDGEYIEQLVKDITTVRSQYQSSYFIIGGDFNLPDIDWESSTVKGHQLPRRVNEEFISMQHDLALVQMVLFPTRGQNTLDLLFTAHLQALFFDFINKMCIYNVHVYEPV
jgi:hypothetical protein